MCRVTVFTEIDNHIEKKFYNFLADKSLLGEKSQRRSAKFHCWSSTIMELILVYVEMKFHAKCKDYRAILLEIPAIRVKGARTKADPGGGGGESLWRLITSWRFKVSVVALTHSLLVLTIQIHLDAVAQEQLKHARCTSSSSSTLQCLAGVINAGLLRGGGRKPCSAAPVPYLVSTLLQSCPGLEVGVQCLHVCRGNSLQCGKYDYVDSYPVLCKSILKPFSPSPLGLRFLGLTSHYLSDVSRLEKSSETGQNKARPYRWTGLPLK
ncbi:hypothetical protein J6590_029671 [Homalodisca vitripennis]|nr:hypothetical protein J6590_029671 [Homalodisca vitripennis]